MIAVAAWAIWLWSTPSSEVNETLSEYGGKSYQHEIKMGLRPAEG
jgi:hypothetical protein